MNTFAYTRVSSKGQLEGDGPERQGEAIRKFCADHSLECLGVWNEAITGTSEGLDRPVFSELLDKAPCIIVVEKMDRLARDLMVSEFLLRECRKRKVKVYAADQDSLTDIAATSDNPSRTFIRQVLGAAAEFEKSALVAKLRVARERKKAKTGRCGGAYPYGHYPGEGRIKTLAIDFVKAGNTLAQTASLLNEAGMKPRFGAAWNKFSVHRIL